MKAEKQKAAFERTDNNDTGSVLELDLIGLFYSIVEKWKFIAAAALAGAVAMGFYSYVLVTPVYEATSKIYVLNSSDSAINLSDLQIGSYLTSDYQQVFETWEVHEMVMQNLGMDKTYAQMRNMIEVSNPSNTRILHISVKNTDPELAARIANEYAYVAKRYISETMETDEPKILSQALVPANPVSPNKTRNIILGAGAGMLLMCLVVIVQNLADDKIKNSDDIKKYTGLPTLAVVPKNSAEKTDGIRMNGKKGA